VLWPQSFSTSKGSQAHRTLRQIRRSGHRPYPEDDQPAPTVEKSRAATLFAAFPATFAVLWFWGTLIGSSEEAGMIALTLVRVIERHSDELPAVSSVYDSGPAFGRIGKGLRIGSESSASGVSSYNTRRGSMPSFFIREIRVVRGIPKRCAAPVAPATRPFVAFRIRTMSSRSPASRVPLRGIALVPWVSSSNGTCSAEPRVKMTERSIMFSSSRMFPGQLQAASFFIAGAGIVWMALFIRRLYFCVKYRTRRGMSSGRSRRGGMRMGNTLSR
jgi:hypothetical protein